MTPEVVINRYLDASQALGLGDVVGFVELLATDADLLGRWLTLLACPAQPDTLVTKLSELHPETLVQLAQTQAWIALPIAGSARLSMEQWQSALRGACLGELLARSQNLKNPGAIRWQVLLAISGFNLAHDAVVEELLEFRGTAPELLEDAGVLLKIFAIVDALEIHDSSAAEAVAQRLLGISAVDFATLAKDAHVEVDALIDRLALSTEEDDVWAERLWARQQVSLLGRLFAQSQSAGELYAAHRLASRNLFDFVPYLLIYDAQRQALTPAAETGVGILLTSDTSTIARSVRERATQALANEANQAVVDRQVLRRLNAREGACVPMFDGDAPVGALAFRVEEDVDQEFLMEAYSAELARWIAVIAAPGPDSQDQVERYREREQQRLREIVHEANNPLSIVHNYLHILELRLQHEPAAAEQIQMIGSELRRAGQLFQQARELPPLLAEPLDEAQAELAIAQFDINDLVRRALELHRGYAREHDVQLGSTVASSALTITSDQQRIAQILNNLLRNAVEACAGASVSVSTSGGVYRGGKEGVELAVDDTGPGLPRSVLERLSEPKQSEKGGDHAGLGLHIVHRLVAELGADIDVRSASGEGTTFRIYLPLDATS